MPTVRIKLPRLYPKQHAAIFEPLRYSWIEGATKSGKTAGCLTWILHKAFKGREGDNFWWVAPVSAQAQIAFDRLRGRDFLRNLDPSLYTVNKTEKSIQIHGAGKVWFKSADKPDSLYGEDVYGAVIDEASRCKPESYDAVRSTLTFTGGQIRIIGNVKGRGNWFYKGCRAAQGGQPGHAYHKLTAQDAVDAGVYPAKELEDARAVFTAQGRLHIFLELYFCEASDDGGNPFGLASIALCTFSPFEGVDTVCSHRDPVVWGWDLAKSVDWTVGIGLDENGDVCRFLRWQKKPWKKTKKWILAATKAPALVDSSGVGDPIVEDLQDLKPGLFEGYTFSTSSKQRLMEHLEIVIGEQRSRFAEGTLKNELDAFEFERKRTSLTYAAPAGLHDDCVMSLGLAAYHLKDALRIANQPEPAALPGLPNRGRNVSGW
jgi:hypothetical protein